MTPHTNHGVVPNGRAIWLMKSAYGRVTHLYAGPPIQDFVQVRALCGARLEAEGASYQPKKYVGALPDCQRCVERWDNGCRSRSIANDGHGNAVLLDLLAGIREAKGQ